MSKKVLKVPFGAPLNDKDSETKTYGCRQNNPDICANNSIPDICANNSIPDICAFTSDDCICKKPSRSWKKQYQKLSTDSYDKF